MSGSFSLGAVIQAIKDNNGVDSQLYHTWCTEEAASGVPASPGGGGFKLVEALVARWRRSAEMQREQTLVT